MYCAVTICNGIKLAQVKGFRTSTALVGIVSALIYIYVIHSSISLYSFERN